MHISQILIIISHSKWFKEEERDLGGSYHAELNYPCALNLDNLECRRGLFLVQYVVDPCFKTQKWRWKYILFPNICSFWNSRFAFSFAPQKAHVVTSRGWAWKCAPLASSPESLSPSVQKGQSDCQLLPVLETPSSHASHLGGCQGPEPPPVTGASSRTPVPSPAGPCSAWTVSSYYISGSFRMKHFNIKCSHAETNSSASVPELLLNSSQSVLTCWEKLDSGLKKRDSNMKALSFCLRSMSSRTGSWFLLGSPHNTFFVPPA